MKPFNDENFMLDNDTAIKLYREYADVKKLPIIDYHCHIPIEEIYEDKHYQNITELWLSADHYKWRQMRANGIEEKYITGDADDYEKFLAYASIMPRLIGNPLYHWSHMELKAYFGIKETLNEKSARAIYEACNQKINQPDFSARKLIKNSNVKLLCTTDDPMDDLEMQKTLAKENYSVKVLPAFRPDRAIDIEKADFREYLSDLGKVGNLGKTGNFSNPDKTDDFSDFGNAGNTNKTGNISYTGNTSHAEIKGMDDLKEVLSKRIIYFKECGCKTADHGLYDAVYVPCTDAEADKILKKALECGGGDLSETEILKYKSYLLIFLAGEYAKHDLVMQLHYGVVRDRNTKMYQKVGINTGFDAMHNNTRAEGLMDLLNAMDEKGVLPKTILYSLNPYDNAVIDCAIGCFTGEGIRNKVTHGSAWWFNDHEAGIREQLLSFASLSTLANHVGMLTDSRSLLSYTRHDYFRRILCSFIGSLVEEGKYPADYETLGEIVKDISYFNTLHYFGFEI